MNETEKRIIQLIDEHREELIAMGNELYTRAERGFAEVNTSAFIADKLKKLGLNVWTFTGYTYEQIINSGREDFMRLLKSSDVLVDGRFELDKRSLELRFKGSSNQRTIDVQASLAKGEPVLWEEKTYF